MSYKNRIGCRATLVVVVGCVHVACSSVRQCGQSRRQRAGVRMHRELPRRHGCGFFVPEKARGAVADGRRAEESTTPGPSWTVAAQACATQEECGQLIRVKPWVRSPLSAGRYFACRTHYSVVDRALARFAPPYQEQVRATRGARRRGEDVGSRGISRWSGLRRADAVLRRPGGVARERGRAVLPVNQCEVNSPSVVPGIATKSPIFSWNVRSCFVAHRRLPTRQARRRLAGLVRTLRARFWLNQAVDEQNLHDVCAAYHN
jgi:hypothetical protein